LNAEAFVCLNRVHSKKEGCRVGGLDCLLLYVRMTFYSIRLTIITNIEVQYLMPFIDYN